MVLVVGCVLKRLSTKSNPLVYCQYTYFHRYIGKLVLLQQRIFCLASYQGVFDMKWLKKIIAVGLFLSLAACSTTGVMGSNQQLESGYTVKVGELQENRRSRDDDFVRDIVAFPFKAAGVVAFGLGVAAMAVDDFTDDVNRYNSYYEEDHSLALSGLGLIGAGFLMYKLGEIIAD